MRALKYVVVLAVVAVLAPAGRASAQEPVNIFDTIGISLEANKGNSQIFGQPSPYSLPAEEMPASRTVVHGGPTDSQDDVWLRMPNTSGTVANLAAFHGQTVILRDTTEKLQYSKVHFFGTTTDGGPAGGDFVLTYSDASTQTVTVQFRDWCDPGDATAAHHIAIGPLTKRWSATSQDGAQCGIYHVPVAVDPAKTLVSVKLPSTTTPGQSPIQAYLMALTLERPDGTFVTPDLGASPFPDDLDAPVSQHALDPASPQGAGGWYRTGVQMSLDAADENGGSGLDRIEYRIGGGAYQPYSAPFTVTGEGHHVVDYRARDRAGNTEAPHSVDVKIDATAPATTARVSPTHPLASGWYDEPVTVTLRGSDGADGSGVAVTQYRIGSGAWQTYRGPIALAQAGTYAISSRSTDTAGNAAAAGPPTVVHVDTAAPLTTAQLAGPGRGPVRVTLAGADGAGGSGVAVTEYRLDGGAFHRYTGPLTVSALGGHLVEFRSVDRAGNLENLRDTAFAIATTSGSGAPLQKFVGLEPLTGRMRASTLARRGLAVDATCVGVGRGTVKLTVSRSVARRLHLRHTTLASRSVRCSRDFDVSVKLKPGRTAARALRRARGTFHAKLTLRMSGKSDTERLTLRGKRRGG